MLIVLSLINSLVIKPFYSQEIGKIDALSKGNIYRTITVYPKLDSFPEDSTLFSVGFSKGRFIIKIKAYQKEKIAASILKNDQEDIMSDDWILVMLDVQGSGNTAYGFQATPKGTKRDFMLTQGGDNVVEWDGKWDVKTQKTDYGYSMMFIIPLNTLSFTKSNWGFRLERYISAKGALQVLCNTGSFQSLDNIAKISIDFSKLSDNIAKGIEKGFKISPSFYIRSFRHDSANAPSSYALMYGGNIRLRKGNATLLDLAIHPDFSDIEADILEIPMNKKPIFYPEKRPFFMEGRDILMTPINLVRTRNFEDVSSGLKFYTKSKDISSIFYVLKDEVFDTISFGKANYSPKNGYNVGLSYIFSPYSYKFISSDADLILYNKEHIGASVQFSRRFDTTSNLFYAKLYRRSEFTGLNMRIEFTHIDKHFLTPLSTLYFDDINEVSLLTEYGIVLKNNIAIKPSISYYQDKAASSDTLKDASLNVSLNLTKNRFSLALQYQTEKMPYLPYNLPEKSYSYQGVALGYSVSSYENVELAYLKGEYLGYASDFKLLKLKLSPFGLFNIGFKYEGMGYQSSSGLPNEDMYQFFGIINIKKLHFMLKPYIGYHKVQNSKEIFTKEIAYLNISDNFGIYGVFQMKDNADKKSDYTLKIVYNF